MIILGGRVEKVLKFIEDVEKLKLNDEINTQKIDKNENKIESSI